MSLRKLYYALPPAWRFWARRLYYLPVDLYEDVSGKRDAMIPPRGLIFTGGGDFKKLGKALVSRLRERGLQPDHSVLDIGSGIGRAAVPLTGYLSEKGRYEGFDIIKKGVEWCKKEISSKYPNFNFQYTPLVNDLYRNSGDKAEQFTFPYADQSFDFAIANSVFTHMLPEETENYLKEAFRVLKPGGVFYATFFVLNPETEKLLSDQKQFNFAVDHGHYKLMSEKVKGANVAYQEDYLRKIAGSVGYKLYDIQFGFWRGQTGSDEFQDILWLTKQENDQTV